MKPEVTVPDLRAGDMLRPVSPKEQAFEELVGRLRERIASGDPMPAERTLVDQLAVKRHTLRKALERLRESGELGTKPPRRGPGHDVHRSGALLARGTNPLEVIEMRLAIEPVLARLAALRATPLDIARIERAATTLTEHQSAAADLAFHQAVAVASRNGLAADIYALLRQIGADARIHVKSNRPRPAGRLRQRDTEHMSIAAAIASRDPDAAERCMRSHLHMVHRQILDRISPVPASEGGAMAAPAVDEAGVPAQQQDVQLTSGLSR